MIKHYKDLVPGDLIYVSNPRLELEVRLEVTNVAISHTDIIYGYDLDESIPSLAFVPVYGLQSEYVPVYAQRETRWDIPF